MFERERRGSVTDISRLTEDHLAAHSTTGQREYILTALCASYAVAPSAIRYVSGEQHVYVCVYERVSETARENGTVYSSYRTERVPALPRSLLGLVCPSVVVRYLGNGESR